MKKKHAIILVSVALLIVVALTLFFVLKGCDNGKVADCQHQWSEATCTEPKTCLICNATEGEALGHDWQGENPRVCARCGATDGSTDATACAHEWTEATCTEPKTCTLCKKTEGTALGHKWQDATCSEPKTCTVCHVTEGDPLGHNWKAATCTSPKICTVCNMTSGAPLGHSYTAATCTTASVCTKCGHTGALAGHTWKAADCENPKTCTVCGKTEGKALGHNWAEATCTAPKTCTVCGKTEGEALGHKFSEATCSEPATCVTCGITEGTTVDHEFLEATCTSPAACKFCGATDGEKLGHHVVNDSCTICGNTDIPDEKENLTLTLVDNGTTDYVIIVAAGSWGKSASSAEGAEYYSAMDLQKYIKNMTGVTVPLKKDTEVPIEQNEKVISVGLTNREGVSYTVDRDAIGEDGYTIKTIGNTVYIAGGRPRGTGYAVYDFLENYFGCKFFTNTLITWPSYDTLTLDSIEDDTKIPAFWLRFLGAGEYTISTYGAAGTAAKANGNYTVGAVYGDRLTYAYRSGDWSWVHTLNHLLDIDPHYYFGEDYECPECHTRYDADSYIPGTSTKWKRAAKTVPCPTCNNATFADFINHLYNAEGYDIAHYISASNEPSGHVRFQPCITGINPITGRNVLDEAIEGVFRWLRESANAGHVNDRLISVSQYDTSWQYGGCECASCKALENLTGSEAGNWIWLCNNIARAIKDDYPDIMVNTISYLYTIEAPVNIKAEDNVGIFICTNDYCAAHPWNECGISLRYPDASDMTKRVAEWQSVADHLYGYDYYRSCGDDRWYYPITYQIYYNYKWYYSLGFEGMYSYMQDELDNFCGLNQYLAAKMMWNPEMSFDEYCTLIDEYCYAAYGPGGDSMAAIVDAYYEQSTKYDICWGMTTRNKFDIMPSSVIFDEDNEIFVLDTSFVDKVQALFDDAFAKAETEEQTKRIELEYINFEYYKLLNYHEIYDYCYDLENCPYTEEELEELIYNTADDIINLLVKYDINSIGYDRKMDNSNKIDLSDAADIDRMDVPDNW